MVMMVMMVVMVVMMMVMMVMMVVMVVMMMVMMAIIYDDDGNDVNHLWVSQPWLPVPVRWRWQRVQWSFGGLMVYFFCWLASCQVLSREYQFW